MYYLSISLLGSQKSAAKAYPPSQGNICRAVDRGTIRRWNKLKSGCLKRGMGWRSLPSFFSTLYLYCRGGEPRFYLGWLGSQRERVTSTPFIRLVDQVNILSASVADRPCRYLCEMRDRYMQPSRNFVTIRYTISRQIPSIELREPKALL